ncbi:MAG: hypothetical protein AAFQ90_09580 [Pseudomonadota bacterium]
MEYPALIKTDHDAVFASLEGETYGIRFPYSAEAVAYAKQSLKAPRFDRQNKVWRVKKRWHKSLPEILEGLAHIAHAADALSTEIENIKRHEAHAADASGRAAIESMQPFKRGITIDIRGGDTIVVTTAYHEEIVSFFRSLGGKWDRPTRSWKLPLAAGSRIAEYRDRIRDWHNEAVKAETSKQRPVRQSNRFIASTAGVPKSGDVVKVHGQWVTITNAGKPFRADENTASIGGPIGIEGEWVCYVYYEIATDEQAREAEADEAKRQSN